MRSSLCEDRISQELQEATAAPTERTSCRRFFSNQQQRRRSSAAVVVALPLLSSSSGLCAPRLLRPGRLAVQARGPGRSPLRSQGRRGLLEGPGAARASAQGQGSSRRGGGGGRRKRGKRRTEENRFEACPARGPGGLVLRAGDPFLLRARKGVSGVCRGRGGELRGASGARGGQPRQVFVKFSLLSFFFCFLFFSLVHSRSTFFSSKISNKKQTSKEPPLTRSGSASPLSPAPSRSPPTVGTAPTRKTTTKKKKKREGPAPAGAEAAGLGTTAGGGASLRRWRPPRRRTPRTSRPGAPRSGSTTSGGRSWAPRCCWGCRRRDSGRTATLSTKVRRSKALSFSLSQPERSLTLFFLTASSFPPCLSLSLSINPISINK